jgi:sterol desaturase/sphingolipid hydroxylase (fatty acid hydroxylase superfamily)
VKRVENNQVTSPVLSWHVIIFSVIFMMFILWIIAQAAGIFLEHDSLLTAKRVYWSFYSYFIVGVIQQPVFYVSVVIIIGMEYFLPARPGQKILSHGVKEDICWYGVGMLMAITLGAAYAAFLYDICGLLFSGLSAHATTDLTGFQKAVIGYLAGDFMGWFHHLIRHKYPGFWLFHSIHHAQKEMNIFTRDRVHPVDGMIALTIKIIPMFMLGVSFDIAFTVIVLDQILDRLSHSNIKSNYGILRYMLVTPQSHRIHHSSDPEHFDTNFGVILSIWDHVFGTQYRNYDQYPETGIPGPEYPHPVNPASVRNIFASISSQLWYPFRELVKQL